LINHNKSYTRFIMRKTHINGRTKLDTTPASACAKVEKLSSLPVHGFDCMMAVRGENVSQTTEEEAVCKLEDSHQQSDSEGGTIDGVSDEGENTDNHDGDEAEREEDEDAVGGWADAMAKILGKKTTQNKSSILVKNKNATERKEQLEKKQQVDKKKMWEMMFREKPDIVRDRETERALQRTATRGVVQLFNAVRKHQKNTGEALREVGGSERKKAKIISSISKKDFIGVLRRTEEGNRVSVKTENNLPPASEKKPAWSVLREDFMMEASMKDWDKNSDTEEADPNKGVRKGSSDLN
ncbi:pre-60S ribosomal particles component, partial [Goodea atripinnis]